MFEWPRKSKSTSGSKGTSYFDHWNFQTIHVFEVMESIADISTELPCYELPRKSRSTSSSRVPQRYWWLYLMDFHNFFTIYVFEVRNPLLTFLLSYDVWVTSIIQVNFRFERYWWFCLKFLKFSHYSCFWGQEIHCWYFYIATMFRWPQKSR